VLWRRYLDFAVTNVPFYLQPILLGCWTMLFYIIAAPARRAMLANLRIIRPGSSPIANHFRAFRTLLNFAWTIAEAATYNMSRAEFTYEIEGREHLEQLGAARGAIVLTAHMGSYDLGAALFAQKFNREIRMVRAPEPDKQTAEHLNRSLQRAADGAVKIDYNTAGAHLAFDLLNALRRGEIVSIQGDRAIAGVASAEGKNVRPSRAGAGWAFHTRARLRGANLPALHRARWFPEVSRDCPRAAVCHALRRIPRRSDRRGGATMVRRARRRDRAALEPMVRLCLTVHKRCKRLSRIAASATTSRCRG
jgi:hypothetical protein